MKCPSFSIAEMMVVVAIVAMDCLAIRMAGSAPANPFFSSSADCRCKASW